MAGEASIYLAATCAALYLLTSLIGFGRDYMALRHVRAELASLQESSGDLMAMKTELDNMESAKRALRLFQSTKGARIASLRQLSIALPPEAWLTGFNADENGTVEIQGYARRAAELVGPLERSKAFSNVEFSSQVMVRDGRERFSLKMTATAPAAAQDKKDAKEAEKDASDAMANTVEAPK